MTHPAKTLTETLGLTLPVTQGGMTFGSDGRLVAAVSEAGGLGTLGTFHYRTFAEVQAQLDVIRAATDKPFAVNVPFFQNNLELVQRCCDAGVKVFTLGGWCTDEVAKLKEEHGLTLLVSVNSPTVARMLEGQPVDVLIVQGNESGGANSQFTTRQLFDLIAPTVDAPVMLAGGQWDGADLHQALLIGAAGIQLGTRFFFCEESPLHPSIKEQVLNHNLKRPLTTTLSPVTSTLNMRFIGNKAFRNAAKTDAIQEIFQDKEKVFALSEAFFEQQAKPVLIYSGTGIYKLDAIETAAQILDGIRADYGRLAQTELPRFA